MRKGQGKKGEYMFTMTFRCLLSTHPFATMTAMTPMWLKVAGALLLAVLSMAMSVHPPLTLNLIPHE